MYYIQSNNDILQFQSAEDKIENVDRKGKLDSLRMQEPSSLNGNTLRLQSSKNEDEILSCFSFKPGHVISTPVDETV